MVTKNLKLKEEKISDENNKRHWEFFRGDWKNVGN